MMPGLSFFGSFEIIVHVKQWSILFRRCFDGPELLIGLLCLFHIVHELIPFFGSTWGAKHNTDF